jgi:outer membrane protein
MRALCAALMAVGMAADAGAMTLEEAFATAYETNPELIAARAALRATDEGVAQARAGLRPRVDITADYGVDWRDDGSSSDSNDPFALNLNATQPLYDGGQTTNNVRAAIADVSSARARLEALEQEILFDVVTAYMDILRDRENVRLAQNNVRVITEEVRASQDRFEVGEVTRTDVSQAQARLAEADANLATARGALDRSQQNFELVVGADPAGLTGPPALPPVPASRDEALRIALESHPLILAARFDENAAESIIRAQIGGLLPSVDLGGSVGYDDTDVFINPDFNALGERTSASVRLRATIPLYQGGAQYSRVRQAQAGASQARANITTVARQRRQLVEAAWTELLVARANIRSVREQVEAQQLAFEGVREEAIVGSRTTLDVLDAEQELLSARVRLVESQRNEYVAHYGLLAAIGSLTMADLDIQTVAYDPDISYERNNDRLFGFEQTEDTVWEEIWRP